MQTKKEVCDSRTVGQWDSGTVGLCDGKLAMQNIKFQLKLTASQVPTANCELRTVNSQKPGNFAHHKFQINFAN